MEHYSGPLNNPLLINARPLPLIKKPCPLAVGNVVLLAPPLRSVQSSSRTFGCTLLVLSSFCDHYTQSSRWATRTGAPCYVKVGYTYRCPLLRQGGLHVPVPPATPRWATRTGAPCYVKVGYTYRCPLLRQGGLHVPVPPATSRWATRTGAPCYVKVGYTYRCPLLRQGGLHVPVPPATSRWATRTGAPCYVKVGYTYRCPLLRQGGLHVPVPPATSRCRQSGPGDSFFTK